MQRRCLQGGGRTEVSERRSDRPSRVQEDGGGWEIPKRSMMLMCNGAGWMGGGARWIAKKAV